jgi:hypothetical protein
MASAYVVPKTAIAQNSISGYFSEKENVVK